MIVFPMVGMSSRFFKAGYTEPKYMLDINGRPCFDYSISGFKKSYDGDHFVFVMRGQYETPEFVKSRLSVLGIENYSIVVLDDLTSGQAETVERGIAGLQDAGENGLGIFNIDTFRLNFKLPNASDRGDGFLETFVGSGDNWSFVLPDSNESGRVAKTTEKMPLSNNCCTGFYHFSSMSDFRFAISRERLAPSMSELYVAPLYNHLILDGRNVRYTTVPSDDVIFCGVPSEYEEIIKDIGGGADFRLKAILD